MEKKEAKHSGQMGKNEKQKYSAPLLQPIATVEELTAGGSGNAAEGNPGQGQGDKFRP